VAFGTLALAALAGMGRSFAWQQRTVQTDWVLVARQRPSPLVLYMPDFLHFFNRLRRFYMLF
jgi:hypothetical protein